MMRAAAMTGLNGLPFEPTVSCSSNCSWPGEFISLGFASECRDVTVEALQGQECVRVEQPILGIHCRMETPGGVFLNSSFAPTEYETALVVNGTDISRTF